MSRTALLALLGLVACGDGLLPDVSPPGPSHDLVVVAHQDDDLLFMQPDVIDAVRTGAGVTSIYLTAGNGTAGVDTAQKRYDGLMAAYGAAAGSTDWSCGWIDVAGHAAEHCRLEAGNVSLVFLGYPDGGKQGEQPTSLLHLWDGSIDQVATVARRPARYDRDGLIEAVTALIRETQPAVIRTLEIGSTHGRDHADHMVAGAVALVAAARAESHAELLSYRGYNTSDEPVNKIAPLYDATLAILARYEACATGCAPCGRACTSIDPTHEIWLHRRYAVGFRPAVTGVMRTGAHCLSETSTGSLVLGSCDTADVWHLDEAGELRSGDHCLSVLPTGELAPSPCLGGPSRRFFLDDEGHVWSGLPPAQVGDMSYAHLWCLVPAADHARAELCGADRAPTWDFAPPVTATDRVALGLTATGREVRLGDLTGDGLADLCAVEAAGLLCAAGDGAGGFAPAVRIDAPAAPLAIEPRSLTLGDVDGDGRPDACGRDAGGILCAPAATGFAAERWTSSFGDAEAQAGTDASLAAIDANADGSADICGLATGGVLCAPHGATLAPLVRSPWPDPAGVLWPGDLDGDHQADWCEATDTGPACGLEALRETTTDGVPWGFSQAGTVEVTPATTATVALADIDGDGRADLCTTRDDRVECARSQGHAFGPRATLALLDGSTAAALWLGDLDGDGRADPCVDAGTSILCAPSRAP